MRLLPLLPAAAVLLALGLLAPGPGDGARGDLPTPVAVATGGTAPAPGDGAPGASPASGVVATGAAAGDLAAAAATGQAQGATRPASERVVIPAGSWVPAFAAAPEPVRVEAFLLDAHPVTVGDYLAFVVARPEWRRSGVPAVFAGTGYLASWRSDLEPGAVSSARGADGAPAREEAHLRPVTEVSWFAARAFCAARGGRLPTTDEWEYAAAAREDGPPAFRDAAFTARLRQLYAARPGAEVLPPVGRTFLNHWGVHDLHGLVWEWTWDFNRQMASGAGRDDQALDRQLFCAAGSRDATDRSDYAAYLRFAFRAGLEGADTGRLLGFRCAYDRGADEP